MYNISITVKNIYLTCFCYCLYQRSNAANVEGNRGVNRGDRTVAINGFAVS